MRKRKIVGSALLGVVLMAAGMIGRARASTSSGYSYWRVSYVQTGPTRPLYDRGYYRRRGHYRRRVVLVAPGYRRHHRLVYVYRRPYYYRRYYVRRDRR